MMSKLRKTWSCVCSKSGSTDSIEALNDLDETQEDDGVGPGGTGTLGTELLQLSLMCGRDGDGSTAIGGPADSTNKTPDHSQVSGFDSVCQDMHRLQEDQGQLVKCFENLTIFHQSNFLVIMEAVQERCDVLEEQLTDFAELFQNEISNLTEELASVEEEISHQSHEGVTNIHEALNALQSLLSDMELEQQQHSWENATDQTLLGKLIDVLLVFLEFVATAVNYLIPLMKPPGHMLSILLLVLFHLLWRH
ncbi:transmembrane and coiled-coil domains protein 1-like isoform X2 [Amphiprion ocellaris]|nr:transmembrane and coiled-coil domains protein 1-like isoform X2 [Amphiprion ocellaris]